MGTIAMRNFDEADFGSLVALWAATGVGDPARGDTLESVKRTLAAGGSLLVLVDEGGPGRGTVVGSCWLTDDARRLYVHHMAVAPALQGTGLGARLLGEAVAIAAAKGLQMKLEVAAENARAIGLYGKFGFGFIGDYRLMIRRAIG